MDIGINLCQWNSSGISYVFGVGSVDNITCDSALHILGKGYVRGQKLVSDGL